MTAYLLLGACLALVAFGAASALASLLSLAAWRGLRAGSRRDAARRARSLFGLRLFPSVASAFVALGLVVPAYRSLEPRGAAEPASAALVFLALASASLIAAGLARALLSWQATRRVVSGWMRGAAPARLPGMRVPTYLIRHPFPVVSVVGVLRPRLFVARAVLDRLSRAELEVVLAHEAAHLAARDNLKGLLMRSCPDWLALGPFARRLEREWCEAAECAADDRAVREQPSRALELAAALLEVARMTPPGSVIPLPASTLHNGDCLAARVARLVETPRPACSREWLAPVSVTLLALPALVCGLGQIPALQRAVHGLSEILVRALS
jgi:hypothetical protein